MVSHISNTSSKQGSQEPRKKNGAAEINHGLLTRQLQRMEVKSTSKDAKHHEKVQKLLENEKKATELRRERKKMLDEMFRSTKPKVSKPTIRRSNEDEERFEFLRRGAMPHPNERKWWNGMGRTNKCLRCREKLGKNPEARKTHYREDHFKVFYTLHRHRQSASVMDKWLLVHLGDARNVPRTCCCCFPFDEVKGYYAGRLALLEHISLVHPRRFAARREAYAVVMKNTGETATDDALHQILMPAKKTELNGRV